MSGPAEALTVETSSLEFPLERVLGRAAGSRPGPTLLMVAGLHGNEPAGLHAVRNVLVEIESSGLSLRGEIVGVAGNLGALRAGRRFLRSDMNRGWTAGRVAAARAGAPDGEERERVDLLVAVEEAVARARGPLIVLDLHTTSSKSPAFLTLGDTLRNRAFGRRLGVPIVLGIEERIHGTLCEYLNERGFVALSAEGGQHTDPASIERLAAVIWGALEAAGALTAEEVPDRERRRALLRDARGSLAGVFEVRYRKPVRAGDRFRMKPGFVNFQNVPAGEVVARTRAGPVAMPLRGRLFLPLYQEQGDDGFFVVRPVARPWLALSALFRRLRLDVLVTALPGVRRSPRHPGRIVVDRRVARWAVVQLFHLLGYREQRTEGRLQVFGRRRHDRPSRRKAVLSG